MPRAKGQSSHNRFAQEQARLDAVAAGRELYWSTVLCLHGHVTDGKTWRRINDYKCHECKLGWDRKAWARRKEGQKARRQTPGYKAAAVARSMRWAKENPERARAHKNAREAAKCTRMPPWADKAAIARFYQNTPPGYHVDHIVPLQAWIVYPDGYKCRASGLHVIANLQYLTAEENQKKHAVFKME